MPAFIPQVKLCFKKFECVQLFMEQGKGWPNCRGYFVGIRGNSLSGKKKIYFELEGSFASPPIFPLSNWANLFKDSWFWTRGLIKGQPHLRTKIINYPLLHTSLHGTMKTFQCLTKERGSEDPFINSATIFNEKPHIVRELIIWAGISHQAYQEHAYYKPELDSRVAFARRCCASASTMASSTW